MTHSIITCLSYAFVWRWHLVGYRISGTIVGSQDRASSILIACARLHNFIIRKDKPFGDNLECFPNDFADLEDVTANPIAPLGMSYPPVVPNEEFQRYDGISRTREAIVEVIREQDNRRPIHNLDRKRREMVGNTVYSPYGSEWTTEFISPL